MNTALRRLAGAACLGLIASALVFLVATYAHGSDIQNQLRLNERHSISTTHSGSTLSGTLTVDSITRPEHVTILRPLTVDVLDKRVKVTTKFYPLVIRDENTGGYIVTFEHPKDMEKPLTVTWLGPILMYSGNSFESVITPSPDYEQGIRSDGVMVWRRIGP